MAEVNPLEQGLTRALADGVVADAEWPFIRPGLDQTVSQKPDAIEATFKRLMGNRAVAIVPAVLEKIGKKLTLYGIESPSFVRAKERAAEQQRLADEIYRAATGLPPPEGPDTESQQLSREEWRQVFDTKLHPVRDTVAIGAIQLFLRRAVDEKLGIEAFVLRFLGEALVPAGLNGELFAQAQALKYETPVAAPPVEPAPEEPPPPERTRPPVRRKKRREGPPTPPAGQPAPKGRPDDDDYLK